VHKVLFVSHQSHLLVDVGQRPGLTSGGCKRYMCVEVSGRASVTATYVWESKQIKNLYLRIVAPCNLFIEFIHEMRCATRLPIERTRKRLL